MIPGLGIATKAAVEAAVEIDRGLAVIRAAVEDVDVDELRARFEQFARESRVVSVPALVSSFVSAELRAELGRLDRAGS